MLLSVWRVTRLAFAGLIGIGGVVVLILAVGAADPPRAGPLLLQLGPLAPTDSQPGQSQVIQAFDLPAAPYTLEVTVELAANSDPATVCSLVFPPSDFGITLDGQGFYSVYPTLPDSMPFIHIRPVGSTNKLALNVEQNGQGTLRINDEIAWQGPVSTLSRAELRVTGGRTRTSRVLIPQISLYSTQR